MRTTFEIQENKFDVTYFVNKIKEDLKEFEFKTFNLGISFQFDMPEDEKVLLKKEFQYNLTVELEKELNKQRIDENSDIEITIDYNYLFITYYVRSTYIYGTYNKYSRELPQTTYYCFKCKGRGCDFCKNTGKLSESSVQETIQKYFLKAFKGKDAKFHGAGREDINVRMLGNGREFIIEIEEPKIRELTTENLKKLEKEVNQEKDVKVNNLKMVNKLKVQEIKSTKYTKLYEATVKTEKEITEEDLKKIELNKIIEIKQKTPTRVKRRRVDKIRERTAEIKKIEFINSTHFKIEIKAESGLYIKEFISGNNNRTNPSISEILNNNSLCEELDVIWIYR